MTLDLLLEMLRSHRAVLQSTAWQTGPGESDGPAFYLDAADTHAIITELTRLKRELAGAHAADLACK